MKVLEKHAKLSNELKKLLKLLIGMKMILLNKK